MTREASERARGLRKAVSRAAHAIERNESDTNADHWTKTKWRERYIEELDKANTALDEYVAKLEAVAASLDDHEASCTDGLVGDGCKVCDALAELDAGAGVN